MGLDAAGNTTAAIGKGFAIGSAAFVSLALYGAFITRSKTNPYGVKPEDAFVITDVQVTDALLFSGLLIGAMLPYAFSAMTMKSVGKAALEMVFEIRRQFTDNPKIRTGEVNPDYERCVSISTLLERNGWSRCFGHYHSPPCWSRLRSQSRCWSFARCPRFRCPNGYFQLQHWWCLGQCQEIH